MDASEAVKENLSLSKRGKESKSRKLYHNDEKTRITIRKHTIIYGNKALWRRSRETGM